VSTKSHHEARWGANFAQFTHTTVCRVMAWLLILTLPLYGLPVHAVAPVLPATEPPSDMSPPSATGGLPSVLEEVGRV
jgi:hypothetical protein